MEIVQLEVLYKLLLTKFYNDYIDAYSAALDNIDDNQLIEPYESTNSEIENDLNLSIYLSMKKEDQYHKELFGLMCLMYIWNHLSDESKTSSILEAIDRKQAYIIFNSNPKLASEIIIDFVDNIIRDDYDTLFQDLISCGLDNVCENYFPQYKRDMKVMDYNKKMEPTKVFMEDYLHWFANDSETALDNVTDNVIYKSLFNGNQETLNTLYENAANGYYMYKKGLLLTSDSNIDQLDKEIIRRMEKEPLTKILDDMNNIPIITKRVLQTYITYLSTSYEDKDFQKISKKESEVGYFCTYLKSKRLAI